MNKYQSIFLGLFLLITPISHAQYLYNKGKMAVKGGNETALYVKGNIKAGHNSEIYHDGKTVLTGNFINDVTSGNVFETRDGVLEFRGKGPQRIEGKANKNSNFIEFPDSVVINIDAPSILTSDFTVTVDTCMGISIKNLKFVKGRLVLDSKPSSTAAGGKTALGHLLVEEGGRIHYNHEASISAHEGLVQVNLHLGNNYTKGCMVGFSSPYRRLYADYFFYNFLSLPSKTGNLLTNAATNITDGVWIKDPLTPLVPGTGQVLGMGFVPHPNQTYYEGILDPQWGGASGAKYADRVDTAFHFARILLKTSFSQFATSKGITDRFAGEEININEVSVPITEGFNFLGNPYTVPLDLSKFVNKSALGDYLTDASDDVTGAIYLLSSGSSGKRDNTTQKIVLTASFETISTVGGTSDEPPFIAPMQMFAIKKNKNLVNTFKMPLNKRKHSKSPFLRSSDEKIDELLIETRDMITGGYDRLCVVFRNDGTLKATHKYDAEKLFNNTGGVNQIYTMSSDNNKLTTNVIPTSTKQIKMYLQPSNERQEVTLKVGRIESLSSVKSVILEDLVTGTNTDLIQKKSYTFLSSPSDKADRFILHFSNVPTGIDELAQQSPFMASYNMNTIYIQGLNDSDMGETISVFDMRGQLIHQQKIVETSFSIQKGLNKGVYIVKTSGDTAAVKFSVK